MRRMVSRLSNGSYESNGEVEFGKTTLCRNGDLDS